MVSYIGSPRGTADAPVAYALWLCCASSPEGPGESLSRQRRESAVHSARTQESGVKPA
jgi:hypothetical protein